MNLGNILNATFLFIAILYLAEASFEDIKKLKLEEKLLKNFFIFSSLIMIYKTFEGWRVHYSFVIARIGLLMLIYIIWRLGLLRGGDAKIMIFLMPFVQTKYLLHIVYFPYLLLIICVPLWWLVSKKSMTLKERLTQRIPAVPFIAAGFLIIKLIEYGGT